MKNVLYIVYIPVIGQICMWELVILRCKHFIAFFTSKQKHETNVHLAFFYRNVNKEKRYEWCIGQLTDGIEDEYNDVVWTDESKIEINRATPKILSKAGEQQVLRAKPKHPCSVSICTGQPHIIVKDPYIFVHCVFSHTV